jgi:peptidoglycan hydrolase CwlO-like protein
MTNTVWKFISAALFLALLISWSYFQFASMLNNSAFESLSHHRTELRRLDNQVAVLNSQLQELQNRNRALNERVEAYNAQRTRDIEFLNSQINRPLVRTVR